MLISPEVREFLQPPYIARLATIDKNGFPHIVPLWYDLEGDDIIIISDRNTRKIDHIARNTKGALQIGGDVNDAAGYLFKGELTAEVDPDYKWLRQVTLRYEPTAQAERDIELWRTTLDMIIIRLKVQRVIKVI
jgi:predicted pyridoxine 5'-phosphate oxidase superfamily flavin-nucleotide-binding protein